MYNKIRKFYMYPQCLGDILFSVHYINVMWHKKILIIGEPRQVRLMSPHIMLIIPFETINSFLGHESLYLIMNLSSEHLRLRIYHYDTFPKVLNVMPEWMVNREELTVLVKRRILATLLEPDELHTILA